MCVCVNFSIPNFVIEYLEDGSVIQTQQWQPQWRQCRRKEKCTNLAHYIVKIVNDSWCVRFKCYLFDKHTPKVAFHIDRDTVKVISIEKHVNMLNNGHKKQITGTKSLSRIVCIIWRNLAMIHCLVLAMNRYSWWLYFVFFFRSFVHFVALYVFAQTFSLPLDGFWYLAPCWKLR